MEKNNLNVRRKALGIGALLYTALKSGAVITGFEDLLRNVLPTLAQSSHFWIKAVGALIEAGSLFALVLGMERVLLLLKTRKIRGEWIYKSSSGNWGHVKISLQATDLRYSVDLYLNKVDLVRALIDRKPAPHIGHGFDELTVYTGDRFYTWYHVPATRYGNVEYAERHGLLTLTPTNDPDSYSATWERTGSISPPDSAMQGSGTAEISRLDQSSASGSFFFFLRKESFVRHKDSIEA